MNNILDRLNSGEKISIDELQPRYREMSPEARTSWFLSEMLTALNDERGYDSAMNSILSMLSTVIHANWLAVFECSEDSTEVIFERCTAGMPPMKGMKFDAVGNTAFGKLFSHIGDKPMAFVPDVAVVQRISVPLYEWFVSKNISSFMAAPFYNEGQVVGFLGAYNYHIDETLDLDRIFKAVSSFVGAHIVNHRLVKTLEWSSDHDVHTGLYNRRGFIQAMKQFQAENPGEACAFVLLDLDDFKRINDLYGHVVGDEALKAAAQALKSTFPADAVVCRNGGDEFLVALMGDTAAEVDDIVKRLSETPIEYTFEDMTRNLTVSIGYACYPEQADSVRELYAKADAALYSVKLAGKASFDKYKPNADSRFRSLLGFTARDTAEYLPYPLIVHKADEPSSLLYASSTFVECMQCDNMYDLMQLTGGSFSGLMPAEESEWVRKRYIKHALSEDPYSDIFLDFRVCTKTGEVKKVSAHSRLVDIPDTGAVFYTFVSPEDL